MDNLLKKIETKFLSFSSNKVNKIILLQQSGSYRKYFRISTQNGSILGVYNPDLNENKAFLNFTKHFAQKGFNVPKIIKSFEAENIYFIQDLGNITLFDFIQTNNDEKLILSTYKKVVDELINLQTEGIKDLDLAYAYPRQSFDNQSIIWDLNYFKYFVLKIAKVPFNEQKLEDDFNIFAKLLTNIDMNYFLFRDFQSKNIMLHDNKIYFIDYQGGRKGAFYYDLASLINDSKANLSDNIKQQILSYYFTKISLKVNINSDEFYSNYYSFALIRLMQAFGAYGFRGLVEHKLSFIKSIPNALNNIKIILKQAIVLQNLPELKKSLTFLIENSELSEKFNSISNVNIEINSFSYKKTGYLNDAAGNGGGFVFDCRFLPNPGKEQEYKNLTGKHIKVIKYLEGYPEVETFISQSVEMIRKAVIRYQKLGYKNLQVNFGCTGGQHRSVYCAEKTAEILKYLYNYNINIFHKQFPGI
ncbi:MAG: phosphotransferase [Bacteroidales bacterium]|nr:phosphotransferase [Bacteroidales bacterium]